MSLSDKNFVFEAITPAKLILSGEHSVVVGAPAVAIPFTKYSSHVILSNSDTSGLNLHLVNFDTKLSLTWQEFFAKADLITESYQDFLAKSKDLTSILKEPADLVLITLKEFFDTNEISGAALEPLGFNLEINSTIPVKSGLGSSASIIIGLLKVFIKFFQRPLDQDKFYALGKKIECYQHGYSSGLDVITVLLEKPVEFDLKKFKVLNFDEKFFWQHAKVLLSGPRIKDTSSIINNTLEVLSNNSDLLNKFKQITEQIIENLLFLKSRSLKNKALEKLSELFYQNQILLSQLQVVPKKFAELSDKLYLQKKMALKVCGAGSNLYNSNAGALLAFSKDALDLNKVRI